jgi:isopenicillin N synthase-like dioxygenase
MMNCIPVIDISPLVRSSSSNEEVKLDVSRAIRQACETVGFFQIVGHGVDQQLVDSLVLEARRFFSQSTEEKQRYAVNKWNSANKNAYRGYFPASVNGKEGLDLASPYLNPEHELVKTGDQLHELNLWSMEGIFTQYWDEMCKLKFKLIRIYY